MVRTKYGFKQFLHKKYPDIIATPIYATSGYILSKPMDDFDNYIYNLQMLPNGQYIVFVGMSIDEATETFQKIKREGIRVEPNDTCPTCFSTFETWIVKRGIKYTNRTYCSNKMPEECFHESHPNKTRRTWYMYEIPCQVDGTEVCVTGVKVDDMFVKVPHTLVQNKDKSISVVCLIKASNSHYKSKRARFIENFKTMQPLYEQLVIALSNDKDEDAESLAQRYLSIQFEMDCTCSVEKMKEAFKHGELTLFLRDKKNVYPVSDEFFESEESDIVPEVENDAD